MNNKYRNWSWKRQIGQNGKGGSDRSKVYHKKMKNIMINSKEKISKSKDKKFLSGIIIGILFGLVIIFIPPFIFGGGILLYTGFEVNSEKTSMYLSLLSIIVSAVLTLKVISLSQSSAKDSNKISQDSANDVREIARNQMKIDLFDKKYDVLNRLTRIHGMLKALISVQKLDIKNEEKMKKLIKEHGVLKELNKDLFDYAYFQKSDYLFTKSISSQIKSVIEDFIKVETNILLLGNADSLDLKTTGKIKCLTDIVQLLISVEISMKIIIYEVEGDISLINIYNNL